MRLEDMGQGLRALARSGALAGRRAAEALGRVVGEAARARGRALAVARRRPDVLLAALLVAGVLAMVLHWS